MIAVMLFHAGVAGFPGGFVGVDIFFVISGFLIGRIVLTEVESGSFRFRDFYDRRARRILPPLLTVVIATLAMGYFLLLPRQFESLGFEALTATAFTSNIWFWRQTGYFHPEAKTQPLLHTWSLGIEEQFYLFLPLLVVIAARVSRRSVVLLIAMVLVASFLLSAASVAYFPSADFFLLPTRAWELLIGVLLASGALSKPGNASMAEAAGFAGMPLLLLPIFLFDDGLPFPGAWAAVPTLGTALVIWAGLRGSRVSTALAAPPLVFVGLLSYSLYLWHWPVYVAIHHWTASATLSAPSIAAAFAASFVLAFLSVRLVEGPLRDRRTAPARLLYPALLVAAALIAAGSAYAILSKGSPGRLDAASQQLAKGAEDFSPTGEACRNLPIAEAVAKCRLGRRNEEPSFLLWGDSHASAIAGALATVADKAGRSGVLIESDGCYPALDTTDPAMTRIDRERCLNRAREVLPFLDSHPQIRDVILTARWYRGGKNPDAAVSAGLRKTLQLMRDRGVRVTVLGGIPQPRADAPWSLATASWRGRDSSLAVERVDRGTFYDMLAGLQRSGTFRFIDLGPAMCRGGTCLAQAEGRSLFTDDNHLSEYAAQSLIAPQLMRARLLGP